MPILLHVDNCSISFGGLLAVDKFHLELKEGELVGLIGPNGAGKSTIFNLISGNCQPTEGEIWFNEVRLNGLRPNRINRLGIARTFQNMRVFPDLSTLDNVRVAFHYRLHKNLWQSIWCNADFQREEAEVEERARELLRLADLERFAPEAAKNLPYGEQRRLEIIRALASAPKLLLLDEPAAGMNPQEKLQLMELILNLRRDFKLTVLLIEHDMKVIMGICPRIIVIDYGEIIAEGPPEKVQKDPKVIEAYLGRPKTHAARN